jgi:hypothetical protein
MQNRFKGDERLKKPLPLILIHPAKAVESDCDPRWIGRRSCDLLNTVDNKLQRNDVERLRQEQDFIEQKRMVLLRLFDIKRER